MPSSALFRRALVRAGALVLLLPAALRAQTATPSPATGAIEGTVRLAGADSAIGGVVVLVPGTGRGAVADAAGRFRIEAVPAGARDVRVDDLRWSADPARIDVAGGATARVALRVRRRVQGVAGVVVTGQRAYHDATATTATRMPAAVIDVPQAVQVVSSQLIDDFGATEFEQVYRAISGVTDSPYGEMIFRGFQQQEVLFNGARGNPYGSLEGGDQTGYSSSVGRLTNVERVEVLKGPAAALYGSTQPGGVLNYVTKQPKPAFEATARATVGQFAQRGLVLEGTGPVNASRTLRWRGAAFAERQDGFRFNTGARDVHVTGALAWHPRAGTRVGVELERIGQELAGQRLRGVPVDSTGRFLTGVRWSANEAEDHHDLDATVAQLVASHAVRGTAFDLTARWLASDRHEEYHEPRGLRADGRSMTREFRDQRRANRDLSVVLTGARTVAPAGLGRHALLAGVEGTRQDWSLRYARIRGAAVPDLDLLDPRYGVGDRAAYGLGAATYSREEVLTRRGGVFVQDLASLGPRWNVLVGARADRYSDDGSIVGETAVATASAVTGRVGVVYKPRPALSLYANTATGFSRPDFFYQTPSANGPFAPSRSRQVEAGAKAELLGGRLFGTAAAFEIVKTNELRPDPDLGPAGNNFSAVLATGEVRSRGVELDVVGSLRPSWTLSANYAFLDSEITRDRDAPQFVGRSWPNAARHAWTVLSRYNLSSRAGLSAAVEHVGRREQPFANIAVPAYTLVDLGVHLALRDDVRLRVNLENALDREYATGALFAPRVGSMPGAPRTLSATLSTTLRRAAR